MQQEQTQTARIKNLPNRPQRTVQAKSVYSKQDCLTNRFDIEIKDIRLTLHLYTFNISDDVPQDSRSMIQELLQSAKGQLISAGLKNYSISGFNIWSPCQVKDRIVAIVENNGQKYTISIEYVKKENVQFMPNSNQDPAQIEQFKQAMNVRVKDVLRGLGLLELDYSSQYFDKKSIDLRPIQGYPLKVWLGYYTSIKMGEQSFQLLIDFASKVLNTQTVLRLVKDLQFNHNLPQYQQELRSELIDKIVLTTYGNYKSYKISGIDFNQNPLSTLKLADGKVTTYKDYYFDKYRIKVQDMKQPLLISDDRRNKNKQYFLIPELVTLTGLTDDQRGNFDLMKKLAIETKKEPENRLRIIQSISQEMSGGLDSSNLTINQNSKTPVYLAPQVVISLENGRKQNIDQTGFFNLRDKVYKPSSIKSWVIIYYSAGREDDELVDDFVANLQKQGKMLGIELNKPCYIDMRSHKPQDWITALDKDFKKGYPQLVVSIIYKNKDTSIYIALKQFLLEQKGVVHQNVTTKSCRNKNSLSIASKIAQQINIKLGNPLWVIPKAKGISEKIMIIGIDVYHKQHNKSCMGFVAHFDLECKTSFSKTMMVEKGEELNKQIGVLFSEALQAYFLHYDKKQLPDTIIIYRDGVGESQINTLINVELNSIKAIFQRLSSPQEAYNPQLAYILVNKRISERFFMKTEDAPQLIRKQIKGSYCNLLPGSIIANRITTQHFDFYLVAQYVNQGTCTPTHYTVLENTTTLSEEEFWQITYLQCYNYQNWTGSVKVPACVQYAHKLAYLIGDTYKGDIHPFLSNKLVFL